MKTVLTPRIIVALAMTGTMGIGCTAPLTEESKARQVVIPDGWTCDRNLWGDSRCTCGCGVQDPDCTANDRTLCKDEGCAENSNAPLDEIVRAVPTLADPRLCANSTCGDGYVERWTERCDDGDSSDANGCMADCKSVDPDEDSTWICGFNGEGCRQAVCANGVLDVGFESCDDGNQILGDGCDDTCQIEDGWACDPLEDPSAWSPPPPSCHPIVCGDGDPVGHDCDDGNIVDGDGCSSTCAVETGWACDGGTECREIECGDDVKDDTEACDDGNLENGDGCTATCGLEMCTARDNPDDLECTEYTALPAAWDLTRCEAEMFGEDGECSCGCGAHDFGCPPEAEMAIEHCQNDGCNDHVDPADLTACAP